MSGVPVLCRSREILSVERDKQVGSTVDLQFPAPYRPPDQAEAVATET